MFAWQPALYEGLESLIIPKDYVWTPDLYVYNKYESHELQ